MTRKVGTPYSEKHKESMKRLLLERRQETLGDLVYYRKNTIDAPDREGGHENPTYASHPADQGTDAQEREKAFMFAQREGDYLHQLDDALHRMEQGKFGVCMACEGRISLERLQVVPTAKLCISCKSKYSENPGGE
ncbi:TraR/DksA C4-type zinc finger protein [bacterium]|nr:TraR/DksA C4-type zinc finger protein [bacterium]